MSIVTRRAPGPLGTGLAARRVQPPIRAQKVVAGARKVLLQQDFSDWQKNLKRATPTEAKYEMWEDWGETKQIYGVNARSGRLYLGKKRAEVRFSKGSFHAS